MPVPAPAVLLVEDSAVHARLLREALSRTQPVPTVKVLTDAETAWPVVHDLVRQPRDSWPKLLVLDIQLKRATGLVLLERIRKDPRFEGWPVVMLTSSRNPADMQQAEAAHATAYLVKPSTVAEYTQVASELSRRWIAPPAQGPA